MVQALRTGELDYARGVNADQFDALADRGRTSTTVDGTANGWTELGFNTYGTGTGNTIEDGGPSTPALLDPAFRDALGYADRQGDCSSSGSSVATASVGTTQVPPFQTEWHIEPADAADVRHRARQPEARGGRLCASMATASASDKEGNPINLRLVMPDSDTTYPDSAEFIAGLVRPDRHRASDPADVRQRDPDRPDAPAGGRRRSDTRRTTTCSSGAGAATSTPTPCSRSSPATRSARRQRQHVLQPGLRRALRAAERGDHPSPSARPLIDQMQEIFYDEAPYHILFYDAALARLPQRPVHRLDEPADRQRHAAVRVRPARLHASCSWPAAASRAPSPSRWRRRRAPTAPARRRTVGRRRSGDGSGDSTSSVLTAVLGLGASPSSPSWRWPRPDAPTASAGRRGRVDRRPRRPSCLATAGVAHRAVPPCLTCGRPWAAPSSAVGCVQALVTILIIVVLNFILFRMMPGSPERVRVRNPGISARRCSNSRGCGWGLDKPLFPDQFVALPRLHRAGRPGLSPTSTAASP